MFRIASLIGQMIGLVGFIVLVIDGMGSWQAGTLVLQSMSTLWGKVSPQTIQQAYVFMANSQWQSLFDQFLAFPAVVDLFGIGFIFSAVGRIGD